MGVQIKVSGKNSSGSVFKNKRFGTEGTLIVILAILFIVMTFASDSFLTFNNLSNLVRQTAINGIVAIGMTFVVITGGIDLSVGSVVGFSGIFGAILMTNGVNVILAIIIAVLVSTLIGIINGILIHDGKVPPFIATLGMMTMVRGGVMLVSDARMIAGLPKSFNNFAQSTLFGIPSLVVVWIVIILIGTFITKWTTLGRSVYALGSNIEAARLSGIKIRSITFITYAISAFVCAIAGILMTSRLGNAIPTGGQGYEMDAIASAVIGGASLSGAEGTIIGTVLGAIIIQTLRNAGNLLGMNPFILDISIGALLVIVVLIDQFNKGRK